MAHRFWASQAIKRLVAGGMLSALAALSGPAGAGEIPVRLIEQVQEWAKHPTVVITLRNRNKQLAGLDPRDIAALDRDWRSQTTSNSQPLIAEVTGAPLSMFLLRQQAQAGGQFIEVFVMDARGLNAGISAVTSDYWQGDEPKFQETFGIGPEAVYFGEVERKDETRHRAQQVSLTIADPDTGEPIGAITAEVNLDIAEFYATSARR